jgi:hypothetical protein
VFLWFPKYHPHHIANPTHRLRLKLMHCKAQLLGLYQQMVGDLCATDYP